MRRALIPALAAALALLTLGGRAYGVEDTVVLYCAMSAEDTNALVRRFEADTGMHLDALRLGADQLPAKILTEQRAGRFSADVELSHGFQTDQLKRAGLLQVYRAPEARDFIAGTVDPDGYWVAAHMNTDVIAYNPVRIKAAGLKPPVSWQELAAPQWRGQLALYKSSYEWYSTMKRALGSTAVNHLLGNLAANQARIVASHQLALNMTAAGEYLVAPNVYGYDANRLKREGQAIDFVSAPPTVVEINAVALVKNAPHPEAARRFVRWLLSRDTQAWLVQSLGRISGRKDAKNDPAVWNDRIRLVISKPADSVNYGEDVRSFDAFFGIKE
jgi:iron(III) transport system substrate-binding protein